MNDDNKRFERELSYLALLLNHNELIEKIRVKPQYLSEKKNQEVLKYIIEYYRKEHVVNPAEILKENPTMDINYMVEIWCDVFYCKGYEHLRIYENMIIDDFKKDCINNIYTKLNNGDITYDEYMAKMKKLDEIKITDSNTVKMKTIDNIDISNTEDVKEFVKSGCNMLDNKINGFILGELSVWSGGNASAKSTYLNQVGIEAINQGYNVAIYSGELTDKRLLNWISMQCAGRRNMTFNNDKCFYYVANEIKNKIFKWLNNKLFIYDNSFGNKVEEIIESVEECIVKNNIKVVILDNLMSMNLSTYGDNKYDVQSKFVQDLSALAKKYNVHIHFVCHPRKTTTFLRKVDISGSADLTNIADNVFIMHRVNNDFRVRSKELFGWNDNDYIFGFSNVLEVCKNREYGVEDFFCGMYFETESKRLKNEPDESKAYGWERMI